MGDWFGAGDSTLVTIEKNATGSGSAPAPGNAATLRIGKYADQRKQEDPRLLGINDVPVRGVSGNRLILDQEAADLVTTAIRKQFESAGYQVLEGSAADNAMFEVSGTIRDLTLNVRNRDEISIAIETTIKDPRSGTVLWSGSVTEKNDRFAGVSGDSKSDVAAYLKKELRIVTGKTVDAVSASLMAAQPGLFNLTAGTRAIPGVSVHVAPAAANPASAVPAITMPNGAGAGLLLVSTTPSRARVYLDGVYYGMSPLRLEMNPGIYAVEVKLEGYKTVSEKVSVRNGDKTEMELNLEH